MFIKITARIRGRLNVENRKLDEFSYLNDGGGSTIGRGCINGFRLIAELRVQSVRSRRRTAENVTEWVDRGDASACRFSAYARASVREHLDGRFFF